MDKLSIDFRMELGMYDPDAQPAILEQDVAFNTVVDANTEFKLSPQRKTEGSDSLSDLLCRQLGRHSVPKQSSIPEPSPALLQQIEAALAAVSVPFTGTGRAAARMVGPAVHGSGGGADGRARSAADSGFCEHGDGDSESGASEASASGSRGSCADEADAEVEAELARVRARLLLPLPPPPAGPCPGGDAAAARLQAAEARAQARWYRQQLEACQADKAQLQQELAAAREQARAKAQRADRLQLEAAVLAERERTAQASASRLQRRLDTLQADVQRLGPAGLSPEARTGPASAPSPAAACRCSSEAVPELGPAGPDPERGRLLARLAAAERGRTEAEARARALAARLALGDNELRARDTLLAEARAQLAEARGQLRARQQQQAQVDKAATQLRTDFARVSVGYRALKAELAARNADCNSNTDLDSDANPEPEEADLQRRRHERNTRVLLRELRHQVRARRAAERRPAETELAAAKTEVVRLRSALAAAEAEGCALAERLRALGGRWGLQQPPAPPPDLTRDLPAPPGRCEDAALVALLQPTAAAPPLGPLRAGLRALRQEVRALRLQLGPDAELVPDVPA